MTPNPTPFDQSGPVKPGYVRVDGFMDVAAYDNARFAEFIEGDPAWHFLLSESGDPSDPALREAVFNTHHFENSMMAQAWNYFVELRAAGATVQAARDAVAAAFPS